MKRIVDFRRNADTSKTQHRHLGTQLTVTNPTNPTQPGFLGLIEKMI